MSDRPSSRFERLLETTARRVGGGSLHPVELLQRVQEAVDGSRTDGTVANDIRIALNPGDYERFRVDFPQLKEQIERLLDATERRDALTRIAERRISFESSSRVGAGQPEVTARFAKVSTLAAGSASAATRRLRRHSGLDLVFKDGSRVPLSHTPFTIGRAADNDLVLADLTVSLHHAVVMESEGGLEIRDVGSRNGIVVDGERVTEAPFTAARPVRLGETVLRLEAAVE